MLRHTNERLAGGAGASPHAANGAPGRPESLPNLIVIGAQKCGTTSLHYYLDRHPEIAMSRAKELNFFVASGSWTKGVDWYAAQFDPAARVRGESSPAYTNYPVHNGVPERVHSVVPDAKLVFLVRDPLERIVSQYLHDYSAGKEQRPVEEALADGLASHPYVARSRYYMQLEQYLPFFEPERILVLTQEELLTERAKTIGQVFEFLEVDPDFYDPRFERIKHRTSSHRRRRTPAGTAVASLALAATRRFNPPRWLAWKAERLLVFPFARRIERPALTSAVREQLIAELEEDANRLREFTGKELEGWCV
jgi:Sulfotransferase domain